MDQDVKAYETGLVKYRRLIKENLCNVAGRDIVIWGTRTHGEEAKAVLESIGCQCSFYISSRPKADTFCGLPIYTPDILDVTKHYVIRTTGSHEVDCFLRKIGYAEGKDSIYLLGRWHDDIYYEGRFVGRGTYGFEYLSSDFGWFVKRIGRYSSINSEARIAGNHPLDYVTTSTVLYIPEDVAPREKWRATVEKNGRPVWNGDEPKEGLVEIGNDVWIGMNVVILPGVKIGDGAVLGAGAVITKDVEPYAIVGGVPAKLIRYRYSKEMIDAFLRIKWWDWPLEQIEENLELFYQPELFCDTFDPR